MGIITSSGTHEAAALTEFYAAINRNDIAGCRELLDVDVERIEPEGHATAGIHKGREEVLAHLAQGRGTWSEGSCEPEQLLAEGGKVIALLHARVRMKERTDWIDGRFADVFEFSRGRIILWRTFWEREEAIKWVEADSAGQ